MTQQPYGGNDPQWGGQPGAWGAQPAEGAGGWGTNPGPPSAGWGAPGTGSWAAPGGYGPPPPAGYPAQGAYQPPGYAGYPGGYPGYGPVGPAGPRRPGSATAAGVLSIVHASWVLFTGILLLAGASWAFDFTDSLGRRSNDGVGEFFLVAVVTIVVGALGLTGGIQMFGGRRTILIWANALSLVISLYWLIRSGFAPEFFWLPLLHSVLPIIAIALAVSAGTTQWLATRPGTGSAKV